MDIDKTLLVPPERIVYSSLREFGIHNFKGRVMGGDWDRLEKRFDGLDVYVAFKQVFIETSKNWTETVFYQNIFRLLRKGELIWGYRDENDLQQRCKYLEKLYRAIRDEGYASKRELLRSSSFWDPLAVDEEVTISIGRDGDLLFSDGGNRLAIAKLLGVKQIPVKIAVRHREWMTFRKELLKYAERLSAGMLYQPATHPDLADIPAVHNCEDRFLMMKTKYTLSELSMCHCGTNVLLTETIGLDGLMIRKHVMLRAVALMTFVFYLGVCCGNSGNA